MTSTIDQVRLLVRSAIADFGEGPHGEALRVAAARLDEPLRVAIAGKVKAGKSTLLNALVGEELAATDAGECTKIVTWYREGIRHRITVHPQTGEPFETHYRHGEGAVDIELLDFRSEDVDRIVVEWPSSALRTTTLIDTPGIASLSADIAQRTHAFLTPEEEPPQADAVLYLMRHAHTSDVAFLEAFHDDQTGRATPVNAIGLLSRADELDGASLGSLESAARIAERYRQDPKMRRLCQTVVPVAALLAQAGATLRESEFRALAAVAALPEAEREGLLLSADRFAGAPSAAVQVEERAQLLGRLGLFGVRFAVSLIVAGRSPTASALSTALTEGSGLRDLRLLLASRFAARADVLKARSALLTVEAVIQSLGAEASAASAEVERIHSSAHEFAEIRLLTALRVGDLGLPPDAVEEAERLLGATGSAAASRAGVTGGATSEVSSALVDAVNRWRRKSESPLSSRALVDAARVVVRSCEGALAELGLSSASS